ncbi:MAG: hypothetical protein ACK462_09350 [Planctomyces sp.]
MASAAIKALMKELVDYAGLFPPAKLDMPRAVEAFARHLESDHAYGLARFVVPVSRLGEFSSAADRYLKQIPERDEQAPPMPWRLTVLIDGKIEENLDAIDRFNQAHQNGTSSHKHAHTAVVDTVEIKAQTPDIVDAAVEMLPEDLFPFIEFPLDGDIRGFAAALAGTGFGAKIRTGGVTPEMFPPAEKIAACITVMHAGEVPFKATAGLHHPIRSVQALTYEPNSPTGMMHGFLNVFVAASLLCADRIPAEKVVEVIREQSPDAFRFDDSGLSWRGSAMSVKDVEHARENFAICFGSCSYDDPTNDLKKLGWL